MLIYGISILIGMIMRKVGRGNYQTVAPVFYQFCQLYREEGWYLERTVHFIARVGLDYVKKRVLEDASGRAALWARLQFALDGEPDPWVDFEKAQVDLRQFQPLALSVPVKESA